MTGACACCAHERKLEARGLCDSCYRINRERGTLKQFARVRREPPVMKTSVLIEEYEFFSAWGLSLEAIAERLGVLPASLKTALWRHAKAQANR